MALQETQRGGSADTLGDIRALCQQNTAESSKPHARGGRDSSKGSSLRENIATIAVSPVNCKTGIRTGLTCWILALLVCLTHQQSYSLVEWAHSNESDFADSGRGVFSFTSIASPMNFMLFTYLTAGSSGSSLLRAYGSDGTIKGSFARPGDDCVGVAMLTSTRFVVAPKTTHHYVTIDAQVSPAGLVTFTLNNARTFMSTHDNNRSSIILEESGTDFVYIGRVAPANIFIRVYFSVSKFSTDGNSNNALRVFIDDVAGFFTMNTLESIDSNTILVAGSTQIWSNFYSVITKSNLGLVVNHAPSNLAIASKVEPLDTTSMYMSFEDNTVRKLTLSSAAVQISVTLPEFYSSLARPARLAFLIAGSLAPSQNFRVLALSTLANVLTLAVAGSPADNSLTLGELFYSRNQTLGFVNKGSKRIDVLFLMQDFCNVPFKLTCTGCTVGRYLTSNSSDYECLLPAEFPVGYGNDSTYMQPCLNSLASGCTSCPVTYTTCAACDTANGYYLYSVQSVCYTVPTMPDTLGVNNAVSPKVVASCSDSNCLKCASDITQCTQCKPSWYLKSPSSGSCYQNNIQGWGVLVSALLPTLKACQDVNCRECFADQLICERCTVNFFQKVGFELIADSCKPNNSPGFGLMGTSPNKIATCLVANCINCFDDIKTCLVCSDGYYLVENAATATCSRNESPGFGLKASAGSLGTKPLITRCLTSMCQDCYLDYSKCIRCAEGFVYRVSDNMCISNNVPGSGVKQMPDGSYIFAPCEIPNCVDCFSSVTNCSKCNSTSHYELVSGTCSLKENSDVQLSFRTPIYFSTKSATFEIELSASVAKVSNLMEKLTWRLVSTRDQTEIPTSEYNLNLVQNSGSVISGRMSSATATAIAPSTLFIQQKDKSAPLFTGTQGYLDPDSIIPISEVVFVPSSEFGVAGGVAVTQFAALLSTLTLGLGANSGAGGSQLSGMLKIIDSIEYVLYWNGDRIYLSSKFIYFWSKDIMEIFDNFFAIDEKKLGCVVQPQFAREDVSSSFINNYGSQMITLAGLLAAFLLVEALSFLSKTLKKRKQKWLVTIGDWLLYLNWLPSKFFTAGLMLALLDGSQIEVIRLSFLTFSHFNTTPGMIGAAIVSAVCSSLYVWLGVQVFRVANIIYDLELKKADLGNQKRLQPGEAILQLAIPNKYGSESRKHKLPMAIHTIRQEIFEHFRKPKPGESKLYLYIPLMFLGKSVLSQGFVVLTPNIGAVQVWILALIETGYVLIILFLKPFKNWQFMMWALLGSGSISAISIVHIFVNIYGSGMEFGRKEQIFGYTLISLYSVSIVVALVPGWIDNAKSFLSWIKTHRKKRQIESQVHKTTLQNSKIPSIKNIKPVAYIKPSTNYHNPAITTNRQLNLQSENGSPRTINQSPQNNIGTRLPPIKVTFTAQSAKIKAISVAKNRMHGMLESMANMSTTRSASSRASSNKLKIIKKNLREPRTMPHKTTMPVQVPLSSVTPQARVGRGSLLHNPMPWNVPSYDLFKVAGLGMTSWTQKPKSEELKKSREEIMEVKTHTPPTDNITKSVLSLKNMHSIQSLSEAQLVQSNHSQGAFSTYASGVWPMQELSGVSQPKPRNSIFKPAPPRRVETSVSQIDLIK